MPLPDDKIKISQLPETINISNEDLIPIVDISEIITKKIQFSNIRLAFNDSPNFTGSVIIPSGTGNFNSLSVNGTGVSLVGHTHNSSNITDFNTSVSGLLPSVSGSGYVTTSFNNNVYNVSITGVQPSGNYTLVGHTHNSSNITDFNTSISGLLPTIANSGDNRILTSTGTSTGINAETNLTYDGSLSSISDKSASLNSPGNYWSVGGFNAGTLPLTGLMFGVFSYCKGTVPSGIDKSRITGNNILATADIPLSATNSGVLEGFYSSAERNGTFGVVDNGYLERLIGGGIGYGHNSIGSGTNPITNYAYGISINRYTGRGTINNSYDIYLGSDVSDFRYQQNIISGDGTVTTGYGIYQENSRDNLLNGSLTVNNGLNAPQKIFSLGTVSGNVSINYDINKQIQTLTLNGTSTNFIEGSGWNLANKSVDVLLEITVTNTTTVIWTLVDDIYNPFPTFNTGKYLVLLRSMGSTIQGHYIGNKTN